jgi:hypothetical protein
MVDIYKESLRNKTKFHGKNELGVEINNCTGSFDTLQHRDHSRVNWLNVEPAKH